MTTVFARAAADPGAPGTHVLIIGIGEYKHLIGGPGKPMDNPMGLKQLTSPPLSARAVCDWFLSRHNNPEAPLSSVEMLLSPAADYLVADKPVRVDSATYDNITTAFRLWYDRLRKSPGSIGALYFSGHGIAAANQYLLAEDFGENELNPWRNALDISTTVRALERAIPGPLYFFIDACRQAPNELLWALGADIAPLISESIKKPVNASSTFLQATADGALAWSRVGHISEFTKALIQALSGFSGTPVPGKSLWAVTGDDMYRAISTILSEDKTLPPNMQIATAQLRAPTTFHFETSPPRDFIELNLTLWERLLREKYPTTSRKAPDQKPDAVPAIVPSKPLGPRAPKVKIFISCGDVDESMAKKIYRDLESRGHAPWLASESLLPGQNRKTTTALSLQNSKLFLALLSKEALSRRGPFQGELRNAIEIMRELPPDQVFIVPARLDDCKPQQDELVQLFPVDLFPEFQQGMDRIVRVIDTLGATTAEPS